MPTLIRDGQRVVHSALSSTDLQTSTANQWLETASRRAS